MLCEHEVYYKEGAYYGRGNMSCDSDVLAIVSYQGQCVYFIDFRVLKEKYKRGSFKLIDHPTQTTYCYLVPLGSVRK